MKRWLERFLVPEESLTHLFKDLYIWTGACHYVPDNFFEYTPWFANAKNLTLLEYKGVMMAVQKPLLWR